MSRKRMSLAARMLLLGLCWLAGILGPSFPSEGKAPIMMWLHTATPEVGTWASQYEKRFNQENPDIDLEVSLSSSLRREELVVTTVAGVGPDIFTDSANVCGLHVQSKIATPIDAFLGHMSDRADLLPNIMQDLVFAGKTYALPVNMYPIVDLYNLDLLRASGLQEPTNWDSMLTAAGKLTRYDPNMGIKVFGYHTDTGDASIGVQLHTKMVQLGRPLIGPDDEKLVINTDIGRRAAEYLHNLWEAGMPGLIAAGKRGTGTLNLFLKGEVAIQNKLSTRQFGTTMAMPHDIAFRRYVGPTPDTAVTQYNAAIILMNSATHYPDQTWRVMESFIQPGNSKEYLLAYPGVLPIRQSLIRDRDLRAVFPHAVELMGLLAPPLVSNGALHPQFPEIREIIGGQVRRMFTEGLGAHVALAEAERLANASM